MWCFICWIVFASLFNVHHCSFEDRVLIEADGIHIRYNHQVKDDKFDFTQTVDSEIFSGKNATSCAPNNASFCLDWGDLGQFRISPIDDNCENFNYRTTDDRPLIVSFDVRNLFLYGANERENQTWPLKDTNESLESYVSKRNNCEAVLEAIWYTDTGFYLYVDPKVPLFVRYAKGKLILTASRRAPYIRGNVTHLDYKVCKYENVKEAFQHAIADTLGKPTAAPDYKMVELPVWSTWAKYKTEINETSVKEFADLIKMYGLPNSQLEIDDEWETCYGSLTVDPARFPDMRGLVAGLHAKGYRVTLWVHPFVNANCSPYFDFGIRQKYFVRNTTGSVVTKWWHGNGAYIDFTNHEAVDWYRMRLQKLLDETGIDSFKFDAGESSWSPQVPVFHVMMDDHPETILHSYIQTAASFGNMVEVRSARQTQKYPIFVRMMDRETVWVGRLAASTLIPELLHMNMIGYPFVLPDMIGGNGYGKDVLTKELFIRWLQICVFMPSLQFSIPPWTFDDEAINITHKYIDLHKKYAPKIYDNMVRATKENTMVNSPIWWLDPTDRIALRIDNEFLVGDDVLVAPVVEQGAVSRDIYFPIGNWRDETIKDSPLIIGPKWVYKYPADLNVLPYFTRVKSNSSSILSPSLLMILLFSIYFLFFK